MSPLFTTAMQLREVDPDGGYRVFSRVDCAGRIVVQTRQLAMVPGG